MTKNIFAILFSFYLLNCSAQNYKLITGDKEDLTLFLYKLKSKNDNLKSIKIEYAPNSNINFILKKEKITYFIQYKTNEGFIISNYLPQIKQESSFQKFDEREYLIEITETNHKMRYIIKNSLNTRKEFRLKNEIIINCKI